MIPVVRFNSMSDGEWSELCQQKYDELADELVSQGYDKMKGKGLYPFFFIHPETKQWYYLARELGSPGWCLSEYND